MRTLSTAATAALQAGCVLLYLVRMELSATVYLNSTAWDVAWDAQTWHGAGQAASIEPATESAGGTTEALRMSLSGVPLDAVALAMHPEDWAGRLCTIYTAIASLVPGAGGGLVVHDAVPDFLGRIAQLDIVESAQTATLQGQIEPLAVDLYRATTSYYSNAEQQRLHPGDRGCEFVIDQSDRPVVWPARSYWLHRQ